MQSEQKLKNIGKNDLWQELNVSPCVVLIVDVIIAVVDGRLVVVGIYYTCKSKSNPFFVVVVVENSLMANLPGFLVGRNRGVQKCFSRFTLHKYNQNEF